LKVKTVFILLDLQNNNNYNIIITMKEIYLIKNFNSLDELNYEKYGSETFLDPYFIDTRLTSLGHKQCNSFKNKISIDKIDLVLVSPLHRALETSYNIFSNNINTICLDQLKEYPNSGYTCNKRKKKSELKQLYNYINFNYISNIDNWDWDIYESKESLDNRIQFVKKYIDNCPNNIIYIVSHKNFIDNFTNCNINYSILN